MDEFEYYLEGIQQAEEAEIQAYQEKARIAGGLLQEISDFLGSATSESEKYLKICFPYGYIRDATNIRKGLLCIENTNTKSNIAYTLMLSDLFTWMLNRTTIQGTLQEMVIKNEILLMASICETLTIIHQGKKKSFNNRVEKMFLEQTISSELKDGLLWLWEKRVGVHIFELSEREFQKYTVADFIKSKEITQKLVNELNTSHGS